MSTRLTNEVLKRFSPMNGLKRQNLEALANKTAVQTLDAGRTLFKAGDTEKRTYFLVSGSLELRDLRGSMVTLEAGAPAAHTAISPVLPRQCTARALDEVEYISLDTDLLDVMLTWDQTGSYLVSELQSNGTNTDDDWMTTLLQTEAFRRIPPAAGKS
jgi:CRP-like cAMP-binding protein